VTRTSPPQVALSSGEISPLLHRRFDYQRFQTGVAKARGFLPMAEGALTRAPGTWYRGRTRGDAAARLVPFQFAANDACVLEFTEGKMRVWRYGALVMSGPSPYELTTPYGAASLPALRWVQSADVLYLCDGLNPIQRLARLALDSWTIAPLQLDSGPFRVSNLNKALTVQASATTGSITLTASAALFTPGHVGSLMRLVPTDNTSIPLWQPEEPLAPGPTALRRYGDNVYELVAGADTGINPPQHLDGTELTDTGIEWLFRNDGKGIVRITAVASGTSATATVLRPLSAAVVADPTYRWSEGAWSALYGYPTALELYDQRLVAAATPTEPRSLWFSAVGDFGDFLDGTDADQAFAYTIAGSGSVNAIQSLQAGRLGLHIFALGEEYSTRAESRATVIGPTTAVFGRDSGIGAAPAKPISPAGDPIFISRDRRRLHIVAYSLEADANRSKDISRPASHLGADKFEEIVWQGVPLSAAWIRTGAGDLAAMIYDPAEEVLGWALVSQAGGVVESLAVTPSADGSLDVLTLVTRRVVNGATVRMVEDQAFPFGALSEELTADQACHLFAATRFEPEDPTATFSLPHLPGAAVEAWTSEGHIDGLTAALDGTVTLPYAVDWAIIGLYDAGHLIDTLDVTAATNDGSSMGRMKRLHDRGAIGLHATAQLRARVIERTLGQPDRIGQPVDLIQRPVGAPGADLFSGIAPFAPPSGKAPEVAYRFTPVGGAPATLTAIVPHVQEAGR
jgi:hypothetical protein